MRCALAVSCLMLLAVSSGCSSNKFAGEWIEEGRVNREGQYVTTEGPRRMALKFEPISTVRAVAYVDAARVVDQQAETRDTYIVMSDGNVVQFGSTIGRSRSKTPRIPLSGRNPAVTKRLRCRTGISPCRPALRLARTSPGPHWLLLR